MFVEISPTPPTGHLGRSAMTCRYRCGDACASDAPNCSGNPTFTAALTQALSRRGLLQAGAVLGGVGALGFAGAMPVAAAASRMTEFTPVVPNTLDQLTVPAGFGQRVVIAWGDPLFAGQKPFDVLAQTAAEQQRRFGFNNDFVGLIPMSGRQRLLVVNHEYTTEPTMFPAYDAAAPTREQVEIAWAAHGLTVVVVDEGRDGGLDVQVGHRLNRRFHTQSAFELTGPAAGHPLVRTTADPAGRTVLGTLNNCAGGLTPWGTWLTAEENFNQYFANANKVTEPVAAARLARYGIAGGASQRRWEQFDPRFDIAKEPNEPHRFGWIVEIDPHDPTSTPKKRTALGRFKHEAAQPQVTPDGRVALYMGDDERFDYFYKFVTRDAMRKGPTKAAAAHNATLLDHGTLYVARFTGDSPTGQIDGSGTLPADGEFDGTGQWIALANDTTSFVPGMTAAEVFLFTRQAADKVGATAMDRPEDVEPHPTDSGSVYIALTNNSNRGAAGRAAADEANPRTNNKHGHVIEMLEDRRDGRSTSFTWRILLVCGDPADPATYFAGYDKSQVSPISCPDNLAFDPDGNLWISTDGNALGTHDGLFMVPLKGAERGHVRQFLTVPRGAETCGPVIERDRILVAVQHPGETDGATVEKPGSTWPDGPGRVPRPAVVAVFPTKR